jgi:hypothetical protein
MADYIDSSSVVGIGVISALGVFYPRTGERPFYGIKTGMILPNLSSVIPSGWLACDGTTKQTSLYPELSAAIAGAYDSAYFTITGLTVPSGYFALPHFGSGYIPLGTTSSLGSGGTSNHAHSATSDLAYSSASTGTHYHGFPNFANGNAGWMNASGDHSHTTNSGNIGGNAQQNPNIKATAGSVGTAGGANSSSHSHSFAAVNTNNSGNHSHGATSLGWMNTSGAHAHTPTNVTNATSNFSGSNDLPAIVVGFLIKT